MEERRVKTSNKNRHIFTRSLLSPMSSGGFQLACQNSMEFQQNPFGWSLSHSGFSFHGISNRIQRNLVESVGIQEPPGMDSNTFQHIPMFAFVTIII